MERHYTWHSARDLKAHSESAVQHLQIERCKVSGGIPFTRIHSDLLRLLSDRCSPGTRASIEVGFAGPAAEDPDALAFIVTARLVSGFSNRTGHPAIGLPCGQGDGLPVGVWRTGRSDGGAVDRGVDADSMQTVARPDQPTR